MAKEKFVRGKSTIPFQEILAKVKCPDRIREASLQSMKMTAEKLKNGEFNKHENSDSE